jgi:invasion protein IalB
MLTAAYRSRSFSGLLALTLGLVLTAHSALALGAEDGKKFKDWTIRCEQYKRPKGKDFEQCHIFQDWKHKEQKLRILHMAVAYPPNSPGRAVAVLTMPLGIYLPGGVKIKIDEGELRDLVVERCEPVGCKAGFPVDPGVLAELKKGVKAYVTFQDMRRKPVTVPVSLRGFTAGLGALK